jgi:hypothetical protein
MGLSKLGWSTACCISLGHRTDYGCNAKLDLVFLLVAILAAIPYDMANAMSAQST